MPSQQANAVPIRADGYSARVYASFFVPRVVASGTLTSAPVYPSGSISPFIATTYAVGAHTDVVRGMEVTFHNPATGELKGRTHIRRAGTINSGTFPIPEFSQAKLNLQTGDVFKVWDEHRLHPRIPSATATFDPEQQFHTDEGSNPPPWINSGGAWAGFVNDGATFASVMITQSASFTADPDSAGTITYVTSLQTGVALQSGDLATEADLVLEVNPGHYTIRHAGTDTGNSKVGNKYTPVMVHNDANPPHTVLITSYDGTPESGFNYTIDVIDGSVTLATIPDGCLCVLWTKERYNEAWAGYRNTAPGREHILGVGYVRRDTTTGGEDGVVTTVFEVESPLSRLKSLTSYSKVMEENATPDAWHEIKTLGVKRADIQLFQFYSNLPEVHDRAYDAALLDERYPAFYVQRSNFYDQSKELLDGIDARMTCDRTGRFSVHTFPPFIPLASRAAITKTWRFTRADVLAWEISRIHFDPVEQYKTSGFSGGASGNNPYFSLYPGAAPGQEGVDTPSRDRLIVDATSPQSDLNERTGRYGAFADDVYMDANGVKWRAFEIKLTLRGGYNFFDFEKEFQDFTESLRGLTRIEDMTDYLFYLTAISWSPSEQGAGETTATFRVATNAASGESYFPPDETLNYPVYDYPLPSWTPLPSTTLSGILGRGTVDLCIPSTDGSLWYLNLRTGETDSVSLTGDITGTLAAAILNAFAPTGALIATNQRAYTLAGLFTTQTVADDDAFAITGSLLAMQSERGTPGLFVVCLYRTSNGGGSRSDVYVTLDGGLNWTDYTSLFGTWPGGNGDNYHMGCCVSPAGTIYTSGWSGAGVTTGILKKSTTQGASWANVGSAFPLGLAHDIHISFQDTAESLIFHGGAESAVNTRYRLYTTTSGGTRTDISPPSGGEKYGPTFPFGVVTCDVDMNSVLCVGQNRDEGGTVKRGVFLSRNRGQTWMEIIPVATTVTYTSGRFAGDDRNTIFLYGEGGAFAVSYDGGATFRTYTLGSGRLINLFGR